MGGAGVKYFYCDTSRCDRHAPYGTITHMQTTKRDHAEYKMVTGAILIILGVIGGWWMVTQYHQKIAPLALAPVATSTATTTNPFSMEPIVPQARVSTEGWKTCRNEEYGWEVKYPGEWYVYGEGNDNGQPEAKFQVETKCAGVNVSINNTSPGHAPTLDYRGVTINADQKALGSAFGNITNVRNLAQAYFGRTLKTIFVINGDEYAQLDSGNTALIVVFHRGQYFEISGPVNASNVLESILSTFHFLDTDTSTTITE